MQDEGETRRGLESNGKVNRFLGSVWNLKEGRNWGSEEKAGRNVRPP